MSRVHGGQQAAGGAMVNRLISTILGVIGAVVGGISGFVVFDWIARYGLSALVLPGAALGLGCGLLARHHSVLRGIACAIAALGLGLYAEWRVAPFLADRRFRYLVLHFYDLVPITQIMIGLGAALAFYLGKDAMFLAPSDSNSTSAKSDVGD
jgi:hypothetical protein